MLQLFMVESNLITCLEEVQSLIPNRLPHDMVMSLFIKVGTATLAKPKLALMLCRTGNNKRQRDFFTFVTYEALRIISLLVFFFIINSTSFICFILRIIFFFHYFLYQFCLLLFLVCFIFIFITFLQHAGIPQCRQSCGLSSSSRTPELSWSAFPSLVWWVKGFIVLSRPR